jgi:hypothetical protein
VKRQAAIGKSRTQGLGGRCRVVGTKPRPAGGACSNLEGSPFRPLIARTMPYLRQCDAIAAGRYTPIHLRDGGTAC